jgi:hypothetical protein
MHQIENKFLQILYIYICNSRSESSPAFRMGRFLPFELGSEQRREIADLPSPTSQATEDKMVSVKRKLDTNLQHVQHLARGDTYAGLRVNETIKDHEFWMVCRTPRMHSVYQFSRAAQFQAVLEGIDTKPLAKVHEDWPEFE